MKKSKKIDSKEIGLDIALILGTYLLKTEYLHYGFWSKGLEVEIFNIAEAQENYSNFIISHIPGGIQTVLDVGCGTGKFALNLINLGFQVDCVSPCANLTKHAHTLLGNKSHIFECCFEQLNTEKRYDVILFSESFQYIDLEKALQNSFKFLNDGGYLLICDVFKKEAKGRSPISGGHKLDAFYHLISGYSYKLIEDMDITKETAPNLELIENLLMHVGIPIRNLVAHFLNNNYPLLFKLLRWKYRKKIGKIDRKYFSGTRNAGTFATFKSYMFFLYQKINDEA